MDKRRIVMPFGPTPRDDGGCFYLDKFINRMPGIGLDRVPVTRAPEEWGEYDAVLYVDWGQDGLGLKDPVFPKSKPIVLWLSDTHMSSQALENRFRWTKQLSPEQHVLFYHPEAVDEYLSRYRDDPYATRHVAWLPAAADHTVYTPPLPHDYSRRAFWPPDPEEIWPNTCAVVPRYDWCWVGHIGDAERDALLGLMCKRFPRFTFWSGIFFEQVARVFHESAIVFNRSVRGDLNMRTFEALASRSFLLTDRQRGMDTLGLKDGEHCALYDGADEASDKMDFYLERPALRERIADAGWRWCLKEHTYLHRAKTLCSLLGLPS